MRRLFVVFVALFMAAVLAAGCGKSEKAKTEDEVKAPKAPAAPAEAAKKQSDMILSKSSEIEMAKAQDVLAQTGVTDSYNPINKPDPFKPFVVKEELNVEAGDNPLLKYDVRYFKLVGILHAGSTPKAVVEDPSGKSYIIGVGDRIGRSGGVIRSIKKDEVVITEQRMSWTKEGTETIEFTIKLHKEGMGE